MNKHAQKRLTDATLIQLAALLVTAGNRNSHGGVPIIVPREMADHIHELAYHTTNHIARKAKLEPVTA